MIDTYGWNRFNPTYAIFVSALNQKEHVQRSSSSDSGDSDGEDDYDGGDDSGMPIDGHFADEEEAAKHVPLTTEQKLICSPLLRGYSLKNKMWLVSRFLTFLVISATR